MEEFKTYAQAKPGVTFDFPFDAETLVFRVGGKMWALTNINQPLAVNLKCDPDLAADLRALHPEIRPGWHMNKRHWNTVELASDTLSRELALKLIDHSWELVWAGLPRRLREEIRGAV